MLFAYHYNRSVTIKQYLRGLNPVNDCEKNAQKLLSGHFVLIRILFTQIINIDKNGRKFTFLP